jgi:anti-sigma factor (TIGR02949 family)
MTNSSMNREDCAITLRRLDEYIDRAVKGDAAGRIAAHLEGCPRCSAELRVRERVRSGLKRAVTQGSEAPPFLAARIRHQIRSTPKGAFWRPRLAAVAAALVVCVAAGIGYQFGRLRLIANAQDSYIAKVSNLLPAGLRPGLRDHIHCALFRKLPSQAATLEDVSGQMGPRYRGLVSIVRRQVPVHYKLMVGHECKYQGRRFVHLAFANEGKLLSVVVAHRVEGELLSSADLLPALTQSGLPFYSASAQPFEVGAFESGRFFVYVVSELPRGDNLEILVALAPGVTEFLGKVEG